MAEGLAYVLWRFDSRWHFHNRHGVELELGDPSKHLKKTPSHRPSSFSAVPWAMSSLSASEIFASSRNSTVPSFGTKG